MKPMEEISNTTNPSSNNNNNNNNNLAKPSSSSSSFERRIRPQKAAAVNCRRCDSTNTKFCYYNNYSLSQPRYFCKNCRRYWTEGGTLRNIPVGGGSRKNKRLSSSSSSNSSYSSVGGRSNRFPDLVVPSASTHVLSQNPRIHHDQYGQDLNLGFSSNFKNVSEFLQEPNFDATKNIPNASALELFNGITARGTTNSFMPVLNPDPNSGYTNQPGQLMIPLPEFKIPSLSFSLDGIGNGDGGAYGNNVHESNSGRILFPFEELKTDTSTTHDDDDEGGQSKDQNCDSNGFWNGMMGGGSCITYGLTHAWNL